jgi:hypothetical protein
MLRQRAFIASIVQFDLLKRKIFAAATEAGPRFFAGVFKMRNPLKLKIINFQQSPPPGAARAIPSPNPQPKPQHEKETRQEDREENLGQEKEVGRARPGHWPQTFPQPPTKNTI